MDRICYTPANALVLNQTIVVVHPTYFFVNSGNLIVDETVVLFHDLKVHRVLAYQKHVAH